MNSRCFLTDSFRKKSIATSLFAVFGTGAFSSYAGAAMEVNLVNLDLSVDSIDYDKIEIDKSKVHNEIYIEILSEKLLHNYEPKDHKLKEWIGENEAILNEIFPSTDEIVKKAFKLNNSQLDCLKKNKLIPDKIDFIFNYLKQVGFGKKVSQYNYDYVSAEEKEDCIKSYIKNPEVFRKMARVVLLKISPSLRGRLSTSIIVGIVVVVLVILFLAFGALYMQKQPVSPNGQNKNQGNLSSTDSSLDSEQSGDKISSEGFEEPAPLSGSKVLAITGAAIVGTAALGVGVKAAVGNNAAPVDVGKPEEVVSVNDDNINKEKASESFVYVDLANAKTNNKRSDIANNGTE